MMHARPWQIKLHKTTLCILGIAAYLGVLRFAIVRDSAALLLMIAPLLPISVFFVVNSKSLGSRFIGGVIGGAAFYSAKFWWLSTWELKLFFPSLHSTEGLLLFCSTVILGAIHGAVASLALCVVCVCLKFIRDRCKNSTSGSGGTRVPRTPGLRA
jgi:hypothetical protein